MRQIGAVELVLIVVVVLFAVALLVRAVRPRRDTPLPPTTTAPTPSVGNPYTYDHISQLVAQDKKIEAIKVLRRAEGLGLREAKERIDAWDPSTTAAEQAAASRTTPVVDPGLAAAARQERDSRGAISAIKLVRERTGWGLKEAKDFVEGL